jgi:hypothetical protein
MNTDYHSIDADSTSSKAPLVDPEIDRLCKSHIDTPVIVGTPAVKAGKFQRPFAASFTMGQSTTNKKKESDIPNPNLESRIIKRAYGVEELEDSFESDELSPEKSLQGNSIISADLPMLTASAFHSSLPSSRARYNFQLGLINTTEMLPEIRSKPTSSPAHAAH